MQLKKCKFMHFNIQFRVFVIAFASFRAIFSVIVGRTHPLPTINAHPSLITVTKSIGNIARRAMFTTTRLGTVQAIHVVRTGIETFVTRITGCTNTLARDMMTTTVVKALT